MRLFAIALAVTVAPALLSQTTNDPVRSPELLPYTQCNAVAGARLTETTKLVMPNSTRTVQTADGKRQVHLLDGLRLAYAFPGSASFASIKIEALDRDHYAQGKTDLLHNFDYLLKSDDLAQEDSKPPQIAGFEVRGLNHKELIGNVLGVYLILDDAHAVETTIYLMNAAPSQRRFATFAEYTKLRSDFVTSYMTCVKQKNVY